MLPYLILGTALLAGLLLAGRWYANAHPRSVIKMLKWSLVSLVVLIAIFFVFTGRLGWAIATLPAFVPWFLRARSVGGWENRRGGQWMRPLRLRKYREFSDFAIFS